MVLEPKDILRMRFMDFVIEDTTRKALAMGFSMGGKN
jgi:hypothetical protein